MGRLCGGLDVPACSARSMSMNSPRSGSPQVALDGPGRSHPLIPFYWQDPARLSCAQKVSLSVLGRLVGVFTRQTIQFLFATFYWRFYRCREESVRVGGLRQKEVERRYGREGWE